MKKGYILGFSLKILLMISAVFLIKYNQVYTTYNLYSKADYFYERLAAEKFIFDEILFRLYIYDYDNFDDEYSDYLFDVKMSENKVSVEVLSEEYYHIELEYVDDCLCFTNILYK